MTLRKSIAKTVLGIAAAVTTAFSGTHASADFEKLSLGGYPVCEASAAALVTCPQSTTETCLLVGDNEVSDRLFLYGIDIEDDDIELMHVRDIDLASLVPARNNKDPGVGDIEALVALPDGDVVVFGSHSRTRKCKLDDERRRVARGSLQAGRLVKGDHELRQSGRHRCDRLFGETRDTHMEIVCFAIEGAERLADHARSQPDKDDREEMCTVDPAFNLEGAAAVPASSGAPRIWVGLRAPVIGGYAVLLRQAEEASGFTFDAVAFVDLHGFGIRELTFDGGRVWGIGGPRTDERTRHVLWRFNADELRHGARIAPVEVAELPRFAEGLAVVGTRALVLMDGRKADDDDASSCDKKSRYIVLDLEE